MQTLTTTLFPCYAPADRPLAERIAAFLERGAEVRVFLDEGELRPGETLAAKAREARMADAVLVLFSRNSLPPRWARLEWEDPLVNEPKAEGVRIAFARSDECSPPRVLAPMFDLSATVLKGLRGIKRWLRGHPTAYTPAPAPDLEVLGIAIADRPGHETVEDPALAREFADAFHEDFDAVFTLDCAGRTLAALAGDLGAQLGMQLEGPLESNLDRLRAFCAARRFLLILEGAAGDHLVFGGKSSTLIARAGSPSPPSDVIREAQQALSHPIATWPELCRLARQARRLLREQSRIAECHELMWQWRSEAEKRNDLAVMDESARELVWILESWGHTDAARVLDYRRAAECDEQMPLPLFD